MVQEVLQRRREPWRWGAQWLAIGIDSDQLRTIIVTDPLAWEVARERSIDHSMGIQHLKQIGKVKKVDKWVPHELTKDQKKKKNHLLKCHLLLFYATTMNHFSIGSWLVIRSGFHITTGDDWAQWLDQEAAKHFPKPNLHQKQSWSLFAGLLPVWSTTAFWILVKLLYLRSM